METRQDLITYLWLTALSLVTVRVHPDVVDLTDMTDLCPYSDFCTSEPRKADIIGGISCCMPCSCSEFCWARDDCCFDVHIPPPDNIAEFQEAVECVPDSFIFEDGQWVGIHGVEHKYMWMISKCVGPTEPDEFSERCTLTSSSSSADLVPVWSPATRDLYRNKYCALCYNVTDYEYLPLDIGDLNGYGEEEENASLAAVDYLIKNTHTTIHVSSTYIANSTGTRVSYCNLTLVSNCRQDSSNIQYIDTIKQKCEKSNTDTVYLSDVTYGNIYYRNVFCFLCNIEYQPFNDTHGPQPIHTHYGLCGVDLLQVGQHWGDPYRLNRYIHVHALSERIDRIDQTCHETEIHDVYMRKCRPLVCPELALAYKGVCYYTRDFETPRTVSFQVTASTELYPSDEVVSKTLMNVGFLSWFYSTVSFCSIEIGVLQHQSVPVLHSRDFIISIGISQRIESNFRNVRNAHAFVSPRKTFGYNLTGVLMKGVDARTFQFTRNWSSSEVPQCVGDFKVIRIWCPTIELSDADFRYCVTHKVLPEDYKFNNPYILATNQTGVRQICLHDYFHAWVGAISASAGCVNLLTPSVHRSISYCILIIGTHFIFGEFICG